LSPDFNFELTDFFLEFKTPFSIAHGTREGTDIVLLELSSQDIRAWGEASLPPYLKEDKNSVRLFISAFFKSGINPEAGLQPLLKRLMNFKEENFAAKACVDIALHNWFAKHEGIPVWKLLGLKKDPLPLCTYTIGMDDKAVIENKVRGAKDFKILKVKLGGEKDQEIINNIREMTSKDICVDVNQGWKTKEHALEMINWLKEQRVLFVEQPLDKNNFHDMLWLFERSSLPLYADESVQIFSDISKVKNCFHGINIKLMKCGGIGEGLKMIHEAKKQDLKILIGSMSETSCGVMAAAQLSPLADYADLDGPLLTKNNPFDMPEYRDGKLRIS